MTTIWKTTEYLFRKEINRLHNLDTAFMAREEGNYGTFSKSTHLADTGASTHMVNSDEGMFDYEEIRDPVLLCDGRKMMATKIGKARMTAVQVDGTTTDVVLHGVKHVPGLDMNLFSVLRSLDQGWNISNDKNYLMLKRGKLTLKFDRYYPTRNGRLVGIDLLPRSQPSRGEVAMPAKEEQEGSKPTKSWDINRMHQVFNHASEEALRRTAKAYGWHLTGKMEVCQECQESNIRKKPVSKFTETKSEKIGERIFIDTSSISETTLGGSKYMIGVVDDATGFTWGNMLKRKKDVVNTMLKFLRSMKSRGTPVKYIRCDNAGENKDLKNKCMDSQDLTDIEFEFTPRNSPQFNGRIERKFAIIYGRMRVNYEAARIDKKMRRKLWGEACMTAIDIENMLVMSGNDESTYKKFYSKDLPKADHMWQFGEMAVVKTTKSIKGKLENRGIPAMYLGRARDHAGDTYRFLNLETELILITRDVIWLNKVYGDYKGSKLEANWDTVGLTPQLKKGLQPKQEDSHDHRQTGGLQAKENVRPKSESTPEHTGMRTRSQGIKDSSVEAESVKRCARELKNLGLNVSKSHTNEIKTGVDTNENENTIEVKEEQQQQENDDHDGRAPDKVAAAVSAFVMVDKLDEDVNELAYDMAFKAAEELDPTKIDPSKYKDLFDKPGNFNEAWNHPDTFQRNKWREAIMKEFDKMELNKVWTKVKRTRIPEGRRCVKHKWVLEIKRNGTFRARLVACGYSQVPGIDFTEIFSPVCNDITFRIVLITMILWKLEGLIFDVTTAFLTGDLEEEIYMECPEGMDHEDDEVVLLNKTIYGLVQASRQYNKKFASILKKMGFSQSRSDPCLFIRRNDDGLVIILTYVDDNLCIGNKEALKKMLKEIVTHGLQITIEEELNDYLSCEILLNKDRSKAWIGQPHMVKKIIKTFGEEVKNKMSVQTPGTPGLRLTKVKEEEHKLPKEKHNRY